MGEICIKSPSLFKEYWNLPQVTKESFTEDGYFKTGDAGRVDEDGHYVILGRKQKHSNIQLLSCFVFLSL